MSKSIAKHSTTSLIKNAASYLLLISTGLVMALATVSAAESKSSKPAYPDAHWVAQNTILLPNDLQSTDWELRSSDTDQSHSFAKSITLTKTDLVSSIGSKFPHLADYQAFTFSGSVADQRSLLKRKLEVISVGEKQRLSIQVGGAIDDLFTSSDADADEVTDYGATVSESGLSFVLWAPRAQSVAVRLFMAEKKLIGKAEMVEDKKSGVWRTVVSKSASSKEISYYQYEIVQHHYASQKVETIIVTDPYSLGLSANGEHSLIVDLDSPATQPKGWQAHPVPALDRPEQQIIYEAHIGDFSALDESTPEESRGKYSAFSHASSAPMTHLKGLRDAGLNTFHLLPVYDIGTVNEVRSERISLDWTVEATCNLLSNNAEFCRSESPNKTLKEVLNEFDPLHSEAQALVEAINEQDDYNWGYDPVHYTVPEGSYASDADGITRILEFRQMVQTLHEMDFRVIMDVVYNHTYEAALERTSVLDKVVPGYYHRLNPKSGEIEQSTCCDNTATERVMMAKLMVDSLIVWARDYKIDGFRFDLMGHQPKSLMLKAREAVQLVDEDTYFYGEGWNFGEVANNAQFVQATQYELAGTSIGTFTDRLRDAIRGGSSFVDGEALRMGQGIGNGLLFDPNDLNINADKGAQTQTYQNYLAITKLGLAANLQDFPIPVPDGELSLGREIPYGNTGAGYALDPADTINYVSKHDNQTLWDNNQYRLPNAMSPDNRARLHLQGLSYPMLAQGIPFIHMGSELARSKSFLRDSYDFGHWFNKVDFTAQNNNYHVGLPPAVKDQRNWKLITQLIKDNQGHDQLTNKQINFIHEGFKDLLSIRSQSPLFSLSSNEQIQQRLSFPESPAGTILMALDDGYLNNDLENLDPQWSHIVVIFNHSPKQKSIDLQNAGTLSLHPVLKSSVDKTWSELSIMTNSVDVPAYTTAVLVRQ